MSNCYRQSRLFRRALAIDLGGIAKGYAIDCAVDALRAHGQLSGSVNAVVICEVFGATAVLCRFVVQSILRRSEQRRHCAMPLCRDLCALSPSSGRRCEG